MSEKRTTSSYLRTKARLIEYDKTAGLVHLSPTGSAWVEDHLARFL